jgi:iron-sulfur cluster insertion protein
MKYGQKQHKPKIERATMLTVTDSAFKQIEAILSDEEDANYVRAFISGGGCSGMNYNFTVESEKDNEDFEIGTVLIDPASMQHLEGATIDFVDDKLKGSHFVITNPNAVTTCGCGSSFGV